eukprot:873810-Pyramimonas_sp.AAC.1
MAISPQCLAQAMMILLDDACFPKRVVFEDVLYIATNIISELASVISERDGFIRSVRSDLRNLRPSVRQKLICSLHVVQAKLQQEDLSLMQRLQRWQQSKGFTRNVIEYALIALFAWRFNAARKPDAAAMRLGVWDKESANALIGTQWRLKLDVGREVGTWMPAGWAASGRRIEIPCAVALEGTPATTVLVLQHAPCTLGVCQILCTTIPVVW